MRKLKRVTCKDIKIRIIKYSRRKLLPHNNCMLVMDHDINNIPKNKIKVDTNKYSSRK